MRRVIPVHPYGVPVYVTASGSASSDTTVWVEPPADMPFEFPQLQIFIGPTIEQSLLDIVFGAARRLPARCGPVRLGHRCRHERSDGLLWRCKK